MSALAHAVAGVERIPLYAARLQQGARDAGLQEGGGGGGGERGGDVEGCRCCCGGVGWGAGGSFGEGEG